MLNQSLIFQISNVLLLVTAGSWVLLAGVGSGGLLAAGLLIGLFTLTMNNKHLLGFANNLRLAISHKQGVPAESKWGA